MSNLADNCYIVIHVYLYIIMQLFSKIPSYFLPETIMCSAEHVFVRPTIQATGS